MWKVLQVLAAVSTFALSADAIVSPKQMVLIPKGRVMLGGPGHSAMPGPAEYNLPAFWIDRFEVTNKNYWQFVVATGHRPPAFAEEPDLTQPDQPVTGVSWQDAADYCAWAGKRLPSEVEWERAARGDGRQTFPWGEGEPEKIAHISGEVPVSVSDNPMDVSPYGVRGMGGNVSEWTSDVFVRGQTCDGGKFPNTRSTTLSFRAYLRGGNWSGLPHMAKNSQRLWDYTDTVADFFGFRCVRSAATL